MYCLQKEGQRSGRNCSMILLGIHQSAVTSMSHSWLKWLRSPVQVLSWLSDEEGGSPGKGGFRLEKLMMRLIFFMDPVSSDSGPRFPRPLKTNSKLVHFRNNTIQKIKAYILFLTHEWWRPCLHKCFLSSKPERSDERGKPHGSWSITGITFQHCPGVSLLTQLCSGRSPYCPL